ncbi:hypothetical protein CU097_008275 [Rhizopus azygosporus]|uniref:Uncharacterized protein n=2 Tax=Rhizopus TaxID=4842 RepID=A0A367KF11_RHIAZ|nr:hypothetical protein BCV71DRAFT_289620 [Rhizopus microsporus]RCI00422.1 hypothetical protein CU097_008275 [Rhizopus azygosporus]
MAATKKRKVEVPSAKIDSFFKRISKPQKPATNECSISENDENQSCSQESITKKPFGLKDTTTMKPLGLKDTTTVKPLGLKDTTTVKPLGLKNMAEQPLGLLTDSKPSKDTDKKTRQPLKEKTPQSSSPLRLSSTVKATARSFNVLCDDDIDKGVKQAPEVQPKAFQVLADDQDELDTQHIRTYTPNSSQWTDCTSSPIEYPDEGDQYGSQESNQVVLSQRIDENDIRQDEEGSRRTNENDIRQDEEGSRRTNENDIRQDEEGLRRTNENDLYDNDDDCDLRLITKTTHKENIVRPILLKKEEEKEDVFEVFNDEPNLVPAGSSSGFGIFFDDDDEDDKENDYVDPDLEFSISSVTSVPIEDSLLTLSPSTEDKVKEVHAPLPYPRGENIVQKLGLEKSSNDDDNDDKE